MKGTKTRRANQTERLYSNRFEEKKSLEYLSNLILSHLAFSCSNKIMRFVISAIGEDRCVAILRKIHPLEKEKNYFDADMILQTMKRKEILSTLRGKMLSVIGKRLSRLQSMGKTDTELRLDILKKTFKLSEIEIKVVTLFYIISVVSSVQRVLDDDRETDVNSRIGFRNRAHIFLNMKRHETLSVLGGKLFNAGIVDSFRGRNLEIADWCSSYLSGIGDNNICHKYFRCENKTDLTLPEFEVAEDEMNILEALIRSKTGCNILFYGEPGTGKTSLAKCLGSSFRKSVLTVNTPEDDDQPSRLRAIYATITVADKEDAVILIDEADEVLNTNDLLFSRSRTNKSWINNILDAHEKKIIWITNKHAEIHPSTMRRFNFSMKFKELTEKKRLKILTSELGKSKFKRLFTEDDLATLCKEFTVDAGGLMNALSVLGREKSINRKTALTRVRTVLRNHKLATTGDSPSHIKGKDFNAYSLEGLNCSENIARIMDAAKNYASVSGHTKKRPLSILLYGMPGTGKSEFVCYLGYTLKKKVILKRSSDVQSKYVGETEKNIAEAFRVAREDDNLLFFDEADSFLFPRRSAQRSWEISHTNEVLTQLENHEGIVIFATNDLPGLDHAALRRFMFKVEFMPLTPEGNVDIYRSMLLPLLPQNTVLSPGEQAQIMALRNLTPGDFAVIRDQFEFADFQKITHERLIAGLMNETRFKQAGMNPIGFNNFA